MKHIIDLPDSKGIKLELFNSFFAELHTLHGQLVEISIDTVSKKRSIKENSYYWGCVIQHFRLGWAITQGERITKEEAHNGLRGKFMCKIWTKLDIRIPISTSTLTHLDFQIYLDDIKDFTSKYLGVEIPAPDKTQTLTDTELETLIHQTTEK